MAVDRHRAWASVVGILTFLLGAAMVVLTFWLAWRMFQTPPQQALNVKPGAPLDLNPVLARMADLVGRVLLLLVMCAIGSVLATRGVRLYASSALHAKPEQPEPKEKP